MGHRPSLTQLRGELIKAAPPSTRFGYQGLRAVDSIAVERCLPLQFLVACDWGLDGPDWDDRLRYFSVERNKPRRAVWTHRSLVAAYGEKLGREFRDYLYSEDAPFAIVPYRSTDFFERLAEESAGRIFVVANPLELKARLDDKIMLREEAERRGIAVVPGRILEAGSLEKGLLRAFGPKLVISEKIGSSGNQTHYIEGAEQLEEWKARLIDQAGKDAPVIVTKYLDGPSVGQTGFIYRGKARLAPGSVMINGLAGCSMHRFDYAGNDYASYWRLPERARRTIQEATLKIGNWAAGMGYRGIFGVDFVLEEGTPYVLEFNPRMLGSTQLMTELELLAGAVPSAFWHLAGLLGAEIREEESAPLMDPLVGLRLNGFQLILRNTNPWAMEVGNPVIPGIYEYDIVRGAPRFAREGGRLADLDGPDQVLVTCSPPERGKFLEPRAVLFKVEGVFSVYDEGAERLLPLVPRLVRGFTQSLRLKKPSGEAKA